MAIGQFSAHLMSPTTIRVVLYSDQYHYENAAITIYRTNDELVSFKIKSTVKQYKVTIVKLELKKAFELGECYLINIQNYGQAYLNVNHATTFANFDRDFYYEGELGALYTREKTTFRLWAPLASQVILKYKPEGGTSFLLRPMTRIENGAYEVTLDGNQDKTKYIYVVLNSGIASEVTDPYAKASSANGLFSYVINLSKIKVADNRDKLPLFTQPTEAIIYETSIRDQTNDERTDIVHKGTFYGFLEKGRKVKGLYPAGFDYITALGVTHLQLLPVTDFKTVDENDRWRLYNWGYDPQQYFVPEGSYARDADDPYNRVEDMMLLVSKLHEKGIRVILDVVYNHVYEHETSVFEKVVPNYYFRKHEDGTISSGSGCGNDFATERPMVRRLVVEAATYLVEQFNIDGYRFDLMGLIDIETIKQIEKNVKALKPDFLMYGEGWEMNTPYPNKLLAHHSNARVMPGVGFFNDSFRDILKGPGFAEHLHEKGYVLGAKNYRDGFCFAYGGSVLNTTFAPRFKSANQSLNYVECHDNGVLVDKMAVSNKDEPVDVHLKRLMSLNTLVMLAFGIPFFHRGQEFGLSKFGDLNSYKSSDRVNQFAYTLAYKRQEFVEYFKEIVLLRKECKFLHTSEPQAIKDLITFHKLSNGGLHIEYNPEKDLAPFKTFNVFINVHSKPLFVKLAAPQKVILNSFGYIAARSEETIEQAMIPPYSVIVLGTRLKEE
ncbi:MAG TPA: type I pullulanase [Bacilli bacterium]|nr:type I pullulanase [Bacilli bacterium]